MSAQTRITCSNGTDCCYKNQPGETNRAPFSGHPRQRIADNVPAFWVEVDDAGDDASFVAENPLGQAVCLFCKNRARHESDDADDGRGFISLAKNGWRIRKAALVATAAKKTARRPKNNGSPKRATHTVTLGEAAGVA